MDWTASKVKVGAQVIALGNGQFTVVVTKGGLPGDGWKRGDLRFSLAGKRQDDTATLLQYGDSAFRARSPARR